MLMEAGFEPAEVLAANKSLWILQQRTEFLIWLRRRPAWPLWLLLCSLFPSFMPY